MESKKQLQTASLVQREFSKVLQDCGQFIYGSEVLVTVTRVRMTSDLGMAYIYVSVYNALYKQETVKELWENLTYLRGELGKRIAKHVRRIPLLKFFIDDTLDQLEHIDLLFNELNQNAVGDSTRSMKQAMEDADKEGEVQDREEV